MYCIYEKNIYYLLNEVWLVEFDFSMNLFIIIFVSWQGGVAPVHPDPMETRRQALKAGILYLQVFCDWSKNMQHKYLYI